MDNVFDAAAIWSKTFNHTGTTTEAFVAGAEWGATNHPLAKEKDQTIAMLAQQLADKKEIIRRLTC